MRRCDHDNIYYNLPCQQKKERKNSANSFVASHKIAVKLSSFFSDQIALCGPRRRDAAAPPAQVPTELTNNYSLALYLLSPLHPLSPLSLPISLACRFRGRLLSAVCWKTLCTGSTSLSPTPWALLSTSSQIVTTAV